MRVLGRARVAQTEPAPPSKCDACQRVGNVVEHREDSGIVYTVCVNVVACTWRKLWEGTK